MISISDFIHLPYTRDLVDAGIAYALRALPHVYPRAGDFPYDLLRRLAGRAAVELAFRRALSEWEIPFEVQEPLPFTDSEHYDVSLDGRRCEIHSFFISRREQMSQIKHTPEILLHAPALVASDQNAADGHRSSDLYIFAFLSGRVSTTSHELQGVIETHQPYYLVHILPQGWVRPAKWSPFGGLVLKSESDETQLVEIGGQEAGGGLRVCAVELPAGKRLEVDEPFHSVAYLHVRQPARGRIGIRSLGRRETHIVGETDWGNLWVYGTDILLAGYLSRDEFNRRASFVREGARVFQYDHTRTKNLAVSVCDLKPLSELFKH